MISHDSAQQFRTLIGSDADPTQSITYGHCSTDAWNWYEQGGLADKIVTFWPKQETNGFTINVASKGDGKNTSRKTQRIKEWLEKEFSRLKLLQVLYDAELQCQLDRAAPIVIYTDGNENLSQAPRAFTKIDRLEVLDYRRLTPSFPVPWAGMAGAADHHIVIKYIYGSQNLYTYGDANNSINPARVLLLQGKKQIATQPMRDSNDSLWGRRMIGSSVVDAATKLDLAVAATGILVQKKNTMIIKAEGLLESIAGKGNVAINDFAQIVKTFTMGSNIQNVQLLDSTMEAQYIERSLAGIADAVQVLKDSLLAHCPSIPETFLFGNQSRGGLAKTNDDRQAVDTTATSLFDSRLVPIINKLINIMLLSGECPEQGFDASMISIARNPSYSKTDEQKVAIRLGTTQADKILNEIGVLTPEEIRTRETAAGYQLSLNI